MDHRLTCFEQQALPHLDAIFKAAFGLCGTKATADDLVQTTFCKAWEQFESFAPGTNCKGWLLRILRNAWIDRKRHKSQGETLVSTEEFDELPEKQTKPDLPPDAGSFLEAFADDQVIQALLELPAEWRFTLYLADVEGMSREEIAEITEVPVGTVKSRTARARAELHAKLADYARDMGITERR